MLAFAYYSLLSFSQEVARDQWLPASLALWVPNLLTAVAAAVLLLRARRGPK